MSAEVLQHVPTGDLKPPPFNPRTMFDDEKMSNLVDSVKAGGIHEPIIGRKVNGHIEIVAGERRWRAAKKAKLETVPIILRELTDAEALEIQIIENEQREDVSPLDQAAGFRKLMDLDPKTYTVEALAERIGLKPASVYLRLKLLAMIEPAKELFRQSIIEAGHAVLIARLSQHDQERAVKYIDDMTKSRGKGDDRRHLGVRELKQWITENVKIDLFGPQLAETQPKVADRLAKLKEKGVEVAQLTRNWKHPDELKKAGVLDASAFREAGKKKCDYTRPGAFVYGEEVQMIDVCTEKKCKTHWPERFAQQRQASAAKRQASESAPAKAKRLKAEAAAKHKREVEEAIRGKVLTAILSTVKSVTKEVLATLVYEQLNAVGGMEFEDELKALGLDKLTYNYGPQGIGALTKASDRQLAQVAVFSVIGERLHNELPKVAKEWGVNVGKLEKELQAAAAATAKGASQAGEKAKRSKAAKKR